MMTGLIGYTGFVGSNIKSKCDFSDYYNSENMDDLKNKSFDYLICCGLSGTKYKIDKDPSFDIMNINNQKKILNTVETNRIIFISTIDVYDNMIDVDENTTINRGNLNDYARNRLDFEAYITSNFNNYHLIRLPMIFGRGLKKNIFFDLINKQYLNKINPNSYIQWYYLDNIWEDIQKVIKMDVKVINLVSEPILIKDIINRFFTDIKLENRKKLINTDIKSIHYKLYSSMQDYIYSKEEIFRGMQAFLTKTYHYDF